MWSEEGSSSADRGRPVFSPQAVTGGGGRALGPLLSLSSSPLSSSLLFSLSPFCSLPSSSLLSPFSPSFLSLQCPPLLSQGEKHPPTLCQPELLGDTSWLSLGHILPQAAPARSYLHITSWDTHKPPLPAGTLSVWGGSWVSEGEGPTPGHMEPRAQAPFIASGAPEEIFVVFRGTHPPPSQAGLTARGGIESLLFLAAEFLVHFPVKEVQAMPLLCWSSPDLTG